MLDSIIPAEWFAQGNLDIQAAEILLAQNGPLAIVAFPFQHAALQAGLNTARALVALV